MPHQDAAAVSSSSSTGQSMALLDETLTFNIKLPVPSHAASIITQALDFGKPVKDTTRRFSVLVPGSDHLRGANDYFFPHSSNENTTTNNNFNNNNTNISLVDVTVTATNARSLRIAVYGLLEQMSLSLKTLEMFAPVSTIKQNNNNEDQSSQLNPFMSSNNSEMMMMSQGGIKKSPVLGPIGPTELLFSGNNNNNNSNNNQKGSGSGSGSFSL